jgi:pimeloyl-ACP methyl ester carboxylesterase
MLKPFIIFFILWPVALTAGGQIPVGHRYKDFIFSDVTITRDLCYRAAPAQSCKKASLFDLYEARGDRISGRPLIIWMHGGGFKFGSKEAKGISLWCSTFARRGYVCAAINYRLSKKNPIFNFHELLKASYYAVQDARAAVSYFKEHSRQYGINPGMIILAGNSAGGIIAMQTAYSSNSELAVKAQLPDTVAGARDQGPLKVSAVINLWGGIFDLDWMKNACVPVVNILGSKDRVVPATHKSAPLYGGMDIHAEAEALHIPNRLEIFEGYSHELEKNFNPFFPAGKQTQKRWLAAGQYAADFLYGTILKQSD